jgi:glucose-1-phosphate cytidylyltransferase
MQTLILAGGYGTRLREETEFRPKPMVEIGDKPILWHIMKTFYHQGFSKFLIAAGYKGQIIKEYFSNYSLHAGDLQLISGQVVKQPDSKENWDVLVRDTGLGTPTGGRIFSFRDTIEESFFCTYGDGLANINLSDLLAFHKSHGGIATVTSTNPISRFGAISIDDQTSQVTSFIEKPQGDAWISSGYFVFSTKIFDYLNQDSILEEDALKNLASDNQLFAFKFNNFWKPMDTLRELQDLNKIWDSGIAPWKNW